MPLGTFWDSLPCAPTAVSPPKDRIWFEFGICWEGKFAGFSCFLDFCIYVLLENILISDKSWFDKNSLYVWKQHTFFFSSLIFLPSKLCGIGLSWVFSWEIGVERVDNELSTNPRLITEFTSPVVDLMLAFFLWYYLCSAGVQWPHFFLG